MTKLRRSPVDENQNYPKHPLGAAKRPPRGILLSLGSHQPGFVKVLSKFCPRPPKNTSIKVTSRLPCIGHLRLNALWIAVEADLNGEDLLSEAHPVFQVLAKPLFTLRRYNGFSEVLRSSEASSQKFSEYIQNGCLKEAKLSKLPFWGRFAAPKGWFG